MRELITSVKNQYLLQVSINYLHQETLEWISEVEFSETELTFLSNLLNKAFLYAREKQKLMELNALEKNVLLFKEQAIKNLLEMLLKHENKLDSLDENSIPSDEQLIREEHSKNGVEVKNYIESVKKFKREIFGIVEIHLRETKKIINDFENGGIVL